MCELLSINGFYLLSDSQTRKDHILNKSHHPMQFEDFERKGFGCIEQIHILTLTFDKFK